MIWIAACVVGFALLFAVYLLSSARVRGEHAARRVLGSDVARIHCAWSLQAGRGADLARLSRRLLCALPVALVTYAAWPRTRYFGNTAPLLVAVLFFALGMAHPHVAGAGFLLAAIPFLFIFVSGVLADLLETRYRPLVMACVVGMMAAYVVWSVVNLAQVPQG